MFLGHMHFQRLPALHDFAAIFAGVLEGVGEMARLNVIAHLMAPGMGEGVAECAVEAPLRLQAESVEVIGCAHIVPSGVAHKEA